VQLSDSIFQILYLALGNQFVEESCIKCISKDDFVKSWKLQAPISNYLWLVPLSHLSDAKLCELMDILSNGWVLGEVYFCTSKDLYNMSEVSVTPIKPS